MKMVISAMTYSDKNKFMNNDRFFKKLLNSKFLYIGLFVLVIFYRYQDYAILNKSEYINIATIITSTISLLLFFGCRYSIYSFYYNKKLKDNAYKLFLIVGICIFSLIFSALLTIPINITIKKYSQKNTIESFNCEITNCTTFKYDKIQFKFLNKRYSINYNIKNRDSRDVINNYYLKVSARKSIWGTYYVERYNLIKR